MARKKSKKTEKRAATSQGAWQGAWSSLSDRRQHMIAVGLLIAVAVGFFAPLHFSKESLIASDTIQWRSMANDMLEYRQEADEAALWAMNPFGGMPGFLISYPNVVPQVDTVVSFTRKLLWPTSYMIVLLIGMYVLVWHLTRVKLVAVFSAAAFGLTTYLPVLLLAGHNTKFIALAWAPWLLLAFILALRKPGIPQALFFAIMASVHLRANHVQITYYIVIICAVWWVVDGVKRVRAGEAKHFVHATFFLFGGVLLALLMIAQPYWPIGEHKAFTTRGAASGGATGGMGWANAMAWSQGPAEMLTLLIANAFGGSGATYWGPKIFTGGPHYFGGLTIALAIYAVVTSRTTATVSLSISTGLMLLFALGDNFSLLNRPAFEYLPFFSNIRAPETWLSAVALTVAALAGIGLSEALGSGSEAVRAKSTGFLQANRNLKLILVSLAAFSAVLLFAGDAMLSYSTDDEPARIFQAIQTQVPDASPDDPRVTQLINQEIARRADERAELFAIDARRTLFFLLTGLLLFVLVDRQKMKPWLAAGGIALLAVLDLGGVGRRYVNADLLTNASDASDAVPEYAFDRFLKERVSEAGGSGRFRVLSLEMGRDPSQNARPSFHYESLGGYHGAKLRVYQDYLDRILFTEGRMAINPAALEIMNVRYVVGRRAAPGYELVFQDDQTGQSVFEKTDIAPRVYFVDAAESVVAPEDVWSRLQSGGFTPRERVLIQAAALPEVAMQDSSSRAEAVVQEHTNRRITVSVDTDAPRWLVLSEVYYPVGWTATVDGAAAEIMQANWVNRAVLIPAGASEVEFRFDPQSHRWGVRLSAISTVVAYGLLFLMLIAARRRES